MSIPSVSVIIPAHNAARTLRACLTSILSAEYNGSVEVIVVDDGSTDDTGTIAQEMGCTLIRRDPSVGPALARNAGAKEARGDILLFVDADTEMRSDTIRQAVIALEQEGGGAVTGMYEPEPINEGFFPRYYAYLKYHAFTAQPTERMLAFGGQCGAIHRTLFEQLGGYKPIPWGVDIENEELGYRINQQSRVALACDFRVRHNFPPFRKLLYVFTHRVYWWIRFSRSIGRRETVLMTRGLGWATAAPTAAMLCLSTATLISPSNLSVVLMLLSGALGLLFAYGYVGLWRLCWKRCSLLFMLGSIGASMFFSFFITASAAWAYLSQTRQKHLPLWYSEPRASACGSQEEEFLYQT